MLSWTDAAGYAKHTFVSRAWHSPAVYTAPLIADKDFFLVSAYTHA